MGLGTVELMTRIEDAFGCLLRKSQEWQPTKWVEPPTSSETFIWIDSATAAHHGWPI